MAITFTQQQQKQKNLTIVLAVVVAAIIAVVWWGFFGGTAEKGEITPVFTLRKAKINFETLKKAELQALNPLPALAVFEGEMGRANPFIPY